MFRTPGGLPLLLEYMYSLYHGPWSCINCPCPLSSLILHNPQAWGTLASLAASEASCFSWAFTYISLPAPKALSLLHFPLDSVLSLVISHSALQIPVQTPFFSSLGSSLGFSILTVLCILPSHHLSQSTTCYISNRWADVLYLIGSLALWGEGLNFCLLTVIISSASLAFPDSSSSIIIDELLNHLCSYYDNLTVIPM